MSADGQERVLDLNVSTDVEFDARAQKRSRSPLNCAASTSLQSKPKKTPPKSIAEGHAVDTNTGREQGSPPQSYYSTMLQSRVPSTETTTAFKQQWSVTRPPRPAACANTQLPALLVPDTYVYRESREEPMSSIIELKDPPEPLTIPEPLRILSSTLKKPTLEPPVMAPDAPPKPPPGPSDIRHLQSGESLNEAEASAKVVIEDRSLEPKSTGGSDGDLLP
ncbi:hypothetical protein HPB52_006553 [Rhipicephalus sanguineus]|uniref:Uncharacterized protein n=1 Tax=Rhipicephalus sanguineus TaxID=34632 RepID=A0A9D4QIS3_RHISA|nr:hypothetical protein HPB52_006553 [Rhipicephalus sanguineus]